MLLSKRLPSVQSLLIFESAARHLSFTGAARELGSTQSAVSQQMRALEERLELVLFRRIYRGVALTDAGGQLYEAVQGGFLQMAACLEQLQNTRLRKTINVATDFAFAAYWLLPKLPRFREQHPDIDVRIITSQGQYDFKGQDVDVALVFSQHKPEHIPAHKLFDEEVFPVCSPSFLEKNGAIQSHKKLASLPLLKLGTDAGQGWHDWSSYFKGRRSQVSPGEPVLTFNNYTLLVQAVVVGQGIGLGWGNLLDDLLDENVLLGLRQFSLESEGGYYVLEPKPQELLQPKRQFIDWLLEEQRSKESRLS